MPHVNFGFRVALSTKRSITYCFSVNPLPLKMEAISFFWDVVNHSLNADREIPEDRYPSKIRGSEDFKSHRVLSDQRCDCFVTNCPSWAAHLRVTGAAFIVSRVQHTREIWRRSWECRGSGSCRFSGFFVRDVWKVFNKLIFPRSSQLHDKSLQR